MTDSLKLHTKIFRSLKSAQTNDDDYNHFPCSGCIVLVLTSIHATLLVLYMGQFVVVRPRRLKRLPAVRGVYSLMGEIQEQWLNKTNMTVDTKHRYKIDARCKYEVGLASEERFDFVN